MKREDVIIGAGLAGLSAAYHMKKKVRLLEAGQRIGGECATDHVNGYHFDKAGHLLHMRDRSIKQLVDKLLPGKLKFIKRDARIRIGDAECRYPFQSNLYHLPAEQKYAALLDYLKAAASSSGKKINDFDTWCRASFGDTITELFLKPYNEKLWTVSTTELTLDWMGAYVPKPDVKRVVDGTFDDLEEGGGYNAGFYYPQKGGIDLLAHALAEKINAPELNSRVTSIDLKNKILSVNGETTIAWNRLISSMPLPALVAALHHPPQRVLNAMKQLSWNSVMVINLGIKRADIHQAHWLYFPEKTYGFYRIGFPGNFGKVGPKGRTAMYIEVGLQAGTGWDKRRQIAARVRRDLIKSKLLNKSDVVETEHIQYIPYAYVIHDKAYGKSRKVLLDYFEKHGVDCIGRWGNWNYSAMEDALIAGKEAAKKLRKKK